MASATSFKYPKARTHGLVGHPVAPSAPCMLSAEQEGSPVDPADRDRILCLYRDAKRMLSEAKAASNKRGTEHAHEALQNAKKLMRDYGIKDGA